MKRLILGALLVLTPQAAKSQTWVETLGTPGVETLAGLAPALDGNTYVAATTDGESLGGLDVLVTRIDRCGAPVWTRALGTTADETVSAIAPMPGGGLLVAGDTGDGASLDAWIVRLDADGDLVWQKRLDGSSFDRAVAVAPAGGGGALVLIATEGLADAGLDAWVVALDGAGVVVWQRAWGGAGDDVPAAVVSASGGGALVAGTTDSSGAGFLDGWAVRLDAAGAIGWQRTFGGPNDDEFRAVMERPSGGFVLVGATDSFGAGLRDAWVVALDQDGTLDWERALGGVDDDEAFAIAAEPGGMAVAAVTRSAGAGGVDGWLARLDAGGGLLTQRTYGGSGDDTLRGLSAVAGGFVLAGEHDDDLWILRVDASGDLAGSCTAAAVATLALSIPSSVAVAPAFQSSAPARGTVDTLAAALAGAASVTTECAPSPGEVSPPGAATPLVFTSPTTLRWEGASASCAETFHVYRGATHAALVAGDYGACLAPAQVEPTLDDADSPAAGQLWTYLVTGVKDGIEGPLGRDGSGNARVNLHPCP